MAHDADPAWSLRTRLIALICGVLLLLWVIGSGVIFLEARTQSDELADRSLRDSALLLLSLAEHELMEHGGPFSRIVSPSSESHDYHIAFQIWDEDGRIMYRSDDASAEPFVPLSTVGYVDRDLDGEAWRIYSAWDDQHHLHVQVGETLTARRDVSEVVLSRLIINALLFLPLTMLLIWAVVSRVFAPLERSARDVAQRSPDDLRPVSARGAPREVLPLLQSLNQLLKRVKTVLDRERHFTADAAHELRTPLAAIRATAQVLGETQDLDEIRSTVDDLLAGVDRGARVVDQLLTLAKMDAQSTADFSVVDLSALVSSESEAQQAFARERQVQLQTNLQPARASGDVERLKILLRNLLDNAIRYTPAGGRVLVACRQTEAGAEISISDSGTGIPPDARERIFERFFRVVGNEQDGSGLGLSIVRRIVEHHAIELKMRDGLDGRGITFTVLFGQQLVRGSG